MKSSMNMKQIFIYFACFVFFAFGVAQEKLPTVFLSPEISFDTNCSQEVAENYIKEIKSKYSSVFDAVSFQLLDAVVYHQFALNNCLQRDVADAKIKAIANKVKNKPNEDVLVFLTRFGFEPSFAVNEKLLRTEEAVNTLLEDATDEYLLMIRNGIPYIHADAQCIVAKALAKNKENCQSVCNLIEQAKRFLVDEVIAKEMAELQASCNCFENKTDDGD
jgi:hypothetical protein